LHVALAKCHFHFDFDINLCGCQLGRNQEVLLLDGEGIHHSSFHMQRSPIHWGTIVIGPTNKLQSIYACSNDDAREGIHHSSFHMQRSPIHWGTIVIGPTNKLQSIYACSNDDATEPAWRLLSARLAPLPVSIFPGPGRDPCHIIICATDFGFDSVIYGSLGETTGFFSL